MPVDTNRQTDLRGKLKLTICARAGDRIGIFGVGDGRPQGRVRPARRCPL